MYADIDGDGKISSGSGRLGDTGDMKVIGNSTPRFLFGLDLYASWKGFDAACMLIQVVGETAKKIDDRTSSLLFAHYPQVYWRGVLCLRRF